jgi:hypothetical protein
LLVELPPLIADIILKNNDVSYGNMSTTLPFANQQLKMKITPADYFRSMIKTIQSHAKREADMIDKCSDLNDNAALILGSGHIKGLITSKSLQEKYHIVALNLTCVSCEDLVRSGLSPEETEMARFSYESKDVFQIKLSTIIDITERNNILAFARDLHNEMQKCLVENSDKKTDGMRSSFFAKSLQKAKNKIPENKTSNLPKSIDELLKLFLKDNTCQRSSITLKWHILSFANSTPEFLKTCREALISLDLKTSVTKDGKIEIVRDTLDEITTKLIQFFQVTKTQPHKHSLT